MKITILALVLVAMSSITVVAQSDGFQRSEYFFGYSYGNPDVNFGIGPLAQDVYRTHIGHNGFNGSAVVNVARYVGIKGDVSGAYKSGRFAFTVPSGIQSNPTTTVAFDGKSAIYNFLAGVQIKDNSTGGRVKPFAHAMIGAAHRNNEISGGGILCIAIIPCPGSTKETAFAGAFGGGLDIRLTGRIAVRLFQIDYNPIKFEAGTNHSFRFSTGLVF